MEVAEARPFELEAVVDMRRAVARRHEQVPQPFGARLVLQLLDDRQDLPAVALALLRVIVGDARPDVLVHERADAVAPLGLGGLTG